MRDSDQLPKISKKVQEKVSSHLFEFSENNIHHNAYDQEMREQHAIEHGDFDDLKASIEESFNGEIGLLGPNPLRHFKNIGIVVITLASRSAIRGGLSAEVAFSLSDTFINEIESFTSADQVVPFVRSCEYQFCRMVQEIKLQNDGRKKAQKNPYINRCKDYIFSHLHEKVTVQILAEELNVNSSYLSDVFRENEGIPLSVYIMQEKINRAKNLLKYSSYTYGEIATYLGFSSQSHLGSQFKKYTGFTPGQYRAEFQKMEEFSSSSEKEY